MWLPKTSLLLLLIVGLARSERSNEDDASSVFIEEAKNLFSQKSIERMAHAFAHSDSSKQVRDKNSCIPRAESDSPFTVYSIASTRFTRFTSYRPYLRPIISEDVKTNSIL